MVSKNSVLLNIQKNRFNKNPKKYNTKFGSFGLACLNNGRLELIQLSLIKKKLKKLIKKKKNERDTIREKIWYFANPNFFLQKKSKNSRMGKGKGLIERKVIRLRVNFIVFEFFGIPLIKIKKLKNYFNKFLNIKFYLVYKFNINYTLWSKNNKFVLYHEKYLFQ